MARTVPLTATKSAGQLITGALWNAGPKAVGDFMLAPPIFRGRQGTAQNITTGTYTALNLDVTDVDSDSGHSNVTNNTRYTCQVAGWYFVEGYFALANSGGASIMAALIAKNGTYVSSSEQWVNRQTDLQALAGSCIVQLSTSDYIEVWGYQASGSTIATFIGSDLQCCMNVFFVSK